MPGVPAPIVAAMIAGTTTPPQAAMIGSRARFRSASSPTTISRFNSRPATKKKTASSPSCAHVPTVRFRWSASGPICQSRSAKYESETGEFAHTRATAAATSRIEPPTVSVRR